MSRIALAGWACAWGGCQSLTAVLYCIVYMLACILS